MATSKDAPASEGDFFSLVGEAFKMYEKSWEALKLNLMTFVLVALIPAGLIMVATFINMTIMFSTSNTDIYGNSSPSVFAFMISWFIMLVALIGALIFAPAITITQLESVKGNKVEFGEVFNKSKKFVLRYIGIALLTGVVIGIPALLMFMTLILIPVAIAWILLGVFFLVLAPYILIDNDGGIVETMKASYALTKANWKWVLAVYVVMWVIGLPGIIPFVGWIASLVLSVMYFCLLPLVYVTKIKSNK